MWSHLSYQMISFQVSETNFSYPEALLKQKEKHVSYELQGQIGWQSFQIFEKILQTSGLRIGKPIIFLHCA